MKKVFMRCDKCGNIVGLIQDSGQPMSCCGQEMTLLKPNKTDAALEKHVPSVKIDGDQLQVQVGSTLHPMTVEHYIQWIMVSQGNKTQRVELTPDDEPKAVFTIDPVKRPINIFEYCNLHGLWEKEESD